MISSLAGDLDNLQETWFKFIESDFDEFEKVCIYQVLPFKFFSFGVITFKFITTLCINTHIFKKGN
jgi:hypothetical protein